MRQVEICYLPSDMAVGQLMNESVNTRLYMHMQKLNPYRTLDAAIEELLAGQMLQKDLIEQLATQQCDGRIPEPEGVQYPEQLTEVVNELLMREHMLLLEYQSYMLYFMSKYSGSSEGLQQLVDSQTRQVNHLVQLKQTLGKYGGMPKVDMMQIIRHSGRSEQESRDPHYILERGYRLERVTSYLNFPNDLTFDDQGNLYVTESGFVYGAQPAQGRILKVNGDGSATVLADGLASPATSATWYNGYFYVAEGGRSLQTGGQISKIAMDGTKQVLLSGLRSPADHFTSKIAFGQDGKMYFGVGSATNSGVVGMDNDAWLKYYPNFHDMPARDLVLNGTNFISSNPLGDIEGGVHMTGSFKPFAQSCFNGETIKGQMNANAVIYRCNPDGSDIEIVADGLRNPYGIGFCPFTGKLYAAVNEVDPRGSRPQKGAYDCLWEIHPGGWYGWPDFFSGYPAIHPHFHIEGEPEPVFVLKQHPALAGQPKVRFPVHASANKFDFSTNPSFGFVREMFIACLGDLDYGKGFQREYGFAVMRVNMETGQMRNFLVNPRGENTIGGPIRPVEAKFSPDGSALYVVDIGILRDSNAGRPQPRTGALWKIVKE